MIPEKVEKVLYAEFKFRMLGDKRERSVRVDAGCEATYLRDSDVVLIEQWLRNNRLMCAGAVLVAREEQAVRLKVAV